MPSDIKITIGGVELEAELNDGTSGRAFSAALPFSIKLSRWGDEYYGECDLLLPRSDDAREEMEVGEMAYWPPGRAFCIFFGPTPASTDDKPRAASLVNPIGRITVDPSALKGLGAEVTAHLTAL